MVRRLITLLVVTLSLALLLSELAVRAIIAFTVVPQSASMTSLRSTARLPQYAHSSYWSPAFADAWDEAQSYLSVNGDGVETINDMSLPGYTVRGGERATTDAPMTTMRDVWLFGPSTVWGIYVADGWTIASYLQRDLNAAGTSWRVHNMGRLGVNAAIEYYWLVRTNIHPGDMVIFIDGKTDLDNSMQGAAIAWREAVLPCRLSAVPSELIKLWCINVLVGDIPDEFVNPLIAEDFPRYWATLDQARSYSEMHGATWLHFMQPASPAVQFTPRYPALYEVLSRDEPVLTIDKADYFDDRHYDDDGHAKIAAAIFRVLTVF